MKHVNLTEEEFEKLVNRPAVDFELAQASVSLSANRVTNHWEVTEGGETKIVIVVSVGETARMMKEYLNDGAVNAKRILETDIEETENRQ